jgi:hypothetical protein
MISTATNELNMSKCIIYIEFISPHPSAGASPNTKKKSGCACPKSSRDNESNEFLKDKHRA